MRALLVGLLLCVAAQADVTRPATLVLREVAAGRFDVTWRVPRRGARVIAVRARLPDAMREVVAPVVTADASVQATRWTVEAQPWELRDAVIAIEGPGAARVDVMVRFEFRDGTVVTRILPPTLLTLPLSTLPLAKLT